MSFCANAADQSTDAQQAFQQLRLLQQKLSQNSGQDDQSSGAVNVANNLNQGNQANAQGTAQTNAPQVNQNQNTSSATNPAVSQSDADVIENKAFKDIVS